MTTICEKPSHVTPPMGGMEGGKGLTAEWLHKIGLTDREIAICSRLWADRMSLREVAEVTGLSHEQVRRYRKSAETKLKSVGVTELPKASRGGRPKTRRMDGRKLARHFTDADKYNAR